MHLLRCITSTSAQECLVGPFMPIAQTKTIDQVSCPPIPSAHIRGPRTSWFQGFSPSHDFVACTRPRMEECRLRACSTVRPLMCDLLQHLHPLCNLNHGSSSKLSIQKRVRLSSYQPTLGAPKLGLLLFHDSLHIGRPSSARKVRDNPVWRGRAKAS